MSDFAARVRKNIEVKDLSEPLQNLAIIFDIEAVRKLIMQHPNERIYVPTIKSFRMAIKRTIAEELTIKRNLDLRLMSYELGCSIDYLRGVVKEIKSEQS